MPREKPSKVPVLCEHRIPDTSYCARCEKDKEQRAAKRASRAGKT